MRSRILVGAVVAFAALGLSAAPAGAKGGGGSNLTCNGTYSGGTYADVTVPTNGVCVLNSATVNGNVTAGTNAYFEASGSTFAHDVVGNGALTLYLWGKSAVNGDLVGNQTAQVFAWNTTFALDVDASNGLSNSTYFGHLQLCGDTVTHDVNISSMKWEVLIGDPAVKCQGNTVQRGHLNVSNNTTGSSSDGDLYIIGNLVSNDSLNVTSNTGNGFKGVHQNLTPNGSINCSGNAAPFDGSGNLSTSTGQCFKQQ